MTDGMRLPSPEELEWRLRKYGNEYARTHLFPKIAAHAGTTLNGDGIHNIVQQAAGEYAQERNLGTTARLSLQFLIPSLIEAIIGEGHKQVLADALAAYAAWPRVFDSPPAPPR